MKKVWKWILGIFSGMVILVILIGVGFAFRMHSFVSGRSWRGLDEGFQNGYRMMPFGGMHRGFGVGPFGGMHGGIGMMGGGIFAGLLQLGLLVLIILGIIWLVRKLRNPTLVTAPVAPVAPITPNTVCGRCGEPVESSWKVCPHCGKKL